MIELVETRCTFWKRR